MHTSLERTMEALRRHGFGASLVESSERARQQILREILPKLRPQVVSYGDSETLFSTGVLDALRQDPAITFIDTFEPGVDRSEILERRRQALLSDLFLLGSNAVTEDGRLVNLDMVGNRVGGLVFGPRKVVVLAGENKIVPDLDRAMRRIKEYCAPANAARHRIRTPCVRTGVCSDCNSADRICNTWTITDRSWPEARIHVILIRGEHGL